MDTKSLVQIPGYRYNEYLLILNPHEDLRNKIMQIKKEFTDKYKAPTATYGKPRITMANFVQLEIMEEKIINSLKMIAMSYHPFKLELKDFGSYPSHSIFINVATKLQVQKLVKELKAAQRLMKVNIDNKPHFINDPNISIALKLKPWQYEQGWLEFSHRHFTGSFIADSMLLIKRPVGENNYQIVQKFEFLNLPVATKQGDLFA